MKYENEKNNVIIKAGNINIGDAVQFGKNIQVKVKGDFTIDSYSKIGDNSNILGNNIIIGKHFYNSSNLRIGGGGHLHPNANFKIGDRCTLHNNFINVCEKVELGNDVGLSHNVSIITHGYWLSVLEGYPADFSSVKLCNGVIAGYRSIILMGVTVGNNAVLGAHSVVTNNLKGHCIYGGNPAKLIKKITPLDNESKLLKIEHILNEYKKISKYHGIDPFIEFNYPIITVNECFFDVEKLTFAGLENEQTDDFRDYVRKWGLRYYSTRPFKSVVQ